MRQYVKNGEYCQNTLRLFAGMPLVKDPDNRPYDLPSEWGKPWWDNNELTN